MKWDYIFLELDNTLISPRNPKNENVEGVSDIYLTDRSYEVLKYHKDNGSKIYVLTNQPLIAMGKRTLDDVYALLYATNYLLGNLLDGFGICPHHPSGVVTKYAKVCACKKPADGLLREFIADRGITREDLKGSLFVGHSSSDATLARQYGMEFKAPSDFF